MRRHESALDDEPASLGQPAEAVDRPCIREHWLEELELCVEQEHGVLAVVGAAGLVDEVVRLHQH